MQGWEAPHRGCAPVRLLARIAGIGATVFGPVAGAQNLGTDIAQALKEGAFGLDLRYRYEFVDDEGFDRNANASTLRTRLAYTSAPVRGFAVTLNLDDVHVIGPDNYNSTRNAKTQYPLIPDPTGTELNLASVTYTGLHGATIVVGRQRLLRGTGRFVANKPWRQNEPTYDAASISYEVNDRLRFFYSYVDKVNRIFGPDPGSPSAAFGGPINLLDASWTPSPLFTVTAYGYWLDLDDAPEAPFFSTRTVGTRITGAAELAGPWSLTYTGEYARQTSIGDNPTNYDTEFYELQVGLQRDGLRLRAAYEHHGGGNVLGEALQAPIGRVHLFRGLADKFAVTPQAGVEDFYVAADADLLRGTFTLAYHDFSAETGGGDYGDELDIFAAWTLAERYELWVGLAHYEASGFSTDTDTVWVMLGASF